MKLLKKKNQINLLDKRIQNMTAGTELTFWTSPT